MSELWVVEGRRVSMGVDWHPITGSACATEAGAQTEMADYRESFCSEDGHEFRVRKYVPADEAPR